jgi:DNA methyltransferase 1-associated protein 1
VVLYKYDDEEWESLIKADSAGWTREETDYLLDLCELYDLRFVVITDRYQV